MRIYGIEMKKSKAVKTQCYLILLILRLLFVTIQEQYTPKETSKTVKTQYSEGSDDFLKGFAPDTTQSTQANSADGRLFFHLLVFVVTICFQKVAHFVFSL